MFDLPRWAAGLAHTGLYWPFDWEPTIAAFFVVLLCAVLWRGGGIVGRTTVTLATAIALVLCGAWVANMMAAMMAARDHAAERHHLEARAFDLTSRALRPG